MLAGFFCVESIGRVPCFSPFRRKHVLKHALRLFCKLDQSLGSILFNKTEFFLMRHTGLNHCQTTNNGPILPGGKLGFFVDANVPMANLTDVI